MKRLNINLPTRTYSWLHNAAIASQRTKTVLVVNAINDYLQTHHNNDTPTPARVKPVKKKPHNTPGLALQGKSDSDSEPGARKS